MGLLGVKYWLYSWESMVMNLSMIVGGGGLGWGWLCVNTPIPTHAETSYSIETGHFVCVII